MNKNKLLIIISNIGILIFALTFIVSLLFSKQLEQAAIIYIKLKATEKPELKVDKLTGINSDSPTITQNIFLSKYRTEVPKLKDDVESIIYLLDEAKTNDINYYSMQLEATIKGFNYTSQLWEYKLIKKGVGVFSTLAYDHYN